MTAKPMPQRIRRGLERVQTVLLVTLLTVMIGVAAYQIIARNLFGTGLHWGADLVQVAMLWITMVGATAAAGSNRHINIDLVSRFAHARLRRLAARVTALFAAALCAALGWYSIAFIQFDFLYETPGFGVVPAWLCESIIPVAAAVMAVEYLVQTVWPPVDRQPSAPSAQGAAETP